jgi:hypothetical protein
MFVVNVVLAIRYRGARHRPTSPGRLHEAAQEEGDWKEDDGYNDNSLPGTSQGQSV